MMRGSLYFRGQIPTEQQQIPSLLPKNEKTLLPTKKETAKNASHNKNEESEGLTLDKIINDLPKEEEVAKYIQNYINKLVKEDESDSSDFDSSEYSTDY